MNICELAWEGLECLLPADREISGGFTSDLLSDVMANLRPGQALVTIQAHTNTVAVAAMTGAPAILFCRGRRPSEETIEAARREGIALFCTRAGQYETTCALASALGEVG